MTNMKIGIDMVDINRFDNYERLKDKILSLKEILMYEKYDNKRIYIASRFALKEAFLKAMGKGVLEIDLKNIEILKKESGEIYILYLDNIYSCSLSHEGNYCIGVALYD